MSSGLDTSVLVRLLTGTPQSAYQRARQFVMDAHHKQEPVWVSDTVVAEAWYALKLHYGTNPDDVRAKLTAMFASGLVQPEPGAGVLRALADADGSTGFVDRLIAARYQQLKAVTVTFDGRLAKLAGTCEL